MRIFDGDSYLSVFMNVSNVSAEVEYGRYGYT